MTEDLLVNVLSHSVMSDFVTPWTIAHQAPLPMKFSRQEYWSGVPFPTLGNLPDPGIETVSLVPPELAGRFFTNCATWEACIYSSLISHINVQTFPLRGNVSYLQSLCNV